MGRRLFRFLWAYFLVWEMVPFSTSAEIIPDVSNAPFLIQTWQTEQGLPHNTINAITQTHDGYLWLGTDAGLARFDGVQCRIFGPKDGLDFPQITALLEDSHGTLWIGTGGGGLSQYAGCKIKTFTVKNGLLGNSINALLQDTNGDIWVGTSTGLNRWRNGRFESVSNLPAHVFVFDLARDREGTIWAATLHNGLLCFKGGKISTNDAPGVQWFEPHCVFVDDKDRVWVGLRDNCAYGYESGKWTRYGTNEGMPPVIIYHWTQTRDGTIWAGSWNRGLYYYQDGRFHSLRVKDGLPSNAILSLFAGDQSLWVGSQSGGLSRVGPKKLSVYRPLQDDSDCLLRSLAETTNGDLWVGTYGQGLFCWRGDEFDQLLSKLPMPANSHHLVEAALGTRDGSVWWGAGPALMQWKDGKLLSLYNDLPWLVGDRVWCLCENPGGGMWVGTFNGKCGLLREGKFVPIQGLSGKPITALVQTDRKTLWIGSLGGGLACLQDGRLTIFGAGDGLGSDLIRTLFLDSKNVLWIGTEGGGLVSWSEGRFTRFTTAQGLIENTVLQILEDDDGNLWLGGNHGISHVNRQALADVAEHKVTSLHPTIYGHSEGILSEECIGNFNAALKTRDRNLCFSTAKGIVMIDPARETENTAPPKVLLEDILVDDRAVDDSMYDTSSIPNISGLEPLVPGSRNLEISPGNHNVEFHYTGFNFSAPSRIQFAYRLAGLDSGWTMAGNSRLAHYGYVPPGQYRFQVKACNSNGHWSPNYAEISLVVQPRFWQTSWFLTLSSLGLLGMGYAGIRYGERRRYRSQLRRLEQERAMEYERARIARDLHDELGASLARISRLSDLSQSHDQGMDRLKKRIESISGFAIRTARSLDEIVWAVNPRNDSLRSLLLYVTQFSRELFEDTGVHCRYQIPDDLPQSPLPPEVRHNLFLVVKEALNNTLKHAQAREILLSAKIEGDYCEIIIQDDGKGFDPAAKQAGGGRNGLINMRHRIETIGGRFDVRSQAGAGTTISLGVNCRTLADSINGQSQ